MSSMKKPHHHMEFNSEQLTSVLEEIRKSNLSVSDIENAIELFEKLAEILMHMSVPLPPASYTIQNSLNSNEWMLYNQLHRLRVASIALLNCKNVTNATRKFARKVSKRAHQTYQTLSQNDEMFETKRPRVSKSVSIQPCNTSSGMRLLNICYICKRRCTKNSPRHEFYAWMCLKCGDLNYNKRNQIAQLCDKVALVTGGRVKIGAEIVLKLLRCGASVIMTTRFPNDAKKRFEAQEDFNAWANRLHIYKLDLRFIPHVERFCEFILSNFKQLDILIHNAAQTIRRPTVYYKSLIDGEAIAPSIYSGNETKCMLPSNAVQIISPTDLSIRKETSQLLVHPEDFKYEEDPLLTQQHFPYGLTDQDGDQLDLRPKNTWITSLDEVKTEEMVEVTLVNYMAPYIMLQKLTQLMQQDRKPDNWRFIVLVSAMEGKFSACDKTGKHPHTNAAKAALNMLVKTSAKHYKQMGILMNAVDTGWVTNEYPVGYKSRLMSGLKPPLDSIDCAARVLDPILETVGNRVEFPPYGKFLKDYKVAGW